MCRSWISTLFSFAVTAFGLNSAPVANSFAGEHPPAQPNIVVILLDDFGWRDAGCYGSTFYETPNIDRLADEGMRFTNSYAASPVCSSTRGSILSGKFPARTGLTDWIGLPERHPSSRVTTAPNRDHLPLEEFILPQAFKQAGYATYFAGKWHVGGYLSIVNRPEYLPQQRGFDYVPASFSSARYLHPYGNVAPQWVDSRKDACLTDRLTDEHLKFLEGHAKRGKPFLAYLSYLAVHTPYEAKPELVQKYRDRIKHLPPVDRRWRPEGDSLARQVQDDPVMAAMIETVDTNIGRVLAKIRELGIEDNTIVILTSDNGGVGVYFPARPHEAPTSNLPLRAGKGHLYEGGIRVPTIVKWPGVVKPGSECHEPVISTDYYPTMLQMAGLPLRPQQHRDGLSIVPLLKGKESLARKALYWHYPHYDRLGDRPAGAVRFGDYKLIEFYEEMRVELFNLKDDPAEQYDLASKMPAKVTELRKMLHAWRKSVHARMPTPNPYYVPNTVPGGLAFTKRPTATRIGQSVRIDFAVRQKTDVAIFIENASGQVVRHLVAGMLGDHAPPPLQPNSLSQSIVWDGKTDSGEVAQGAPFRVRVGLGLTARRDRTVLSEPLNFAGSKGGVFALATDRDGTLFVTSGFGAHVPNWTGYQMTALDASGRYRSTLLPPSAETTAEDWRQFGTDSVVVDGRTTPLIQSLSGRRFFGDRVNRKTGMAVTSSGVVLLLAGPRIAAVTTDGKPAWESYSGPRLLPDAKGLQLGDHAALAVSSDGKFAYVSGLRDGSPRRGKPAFAAVYRVALPARGPAEVFFGTAKEPGSGAEQLGAEPRGLATDGNGRLLIADHANDRIVVVREEDGSFVASLPVERPHHVAVDSESGAVYVTRIVERGAVELVKYSSWNDARPMLRLKLDGDGNPAYPWSMAVGKSGNTPVVWMGSDGGRLLRITEVNGKFVSKQISTREPGNAAFGDIQVDRFRSSPDVYIRAGQGTWQRFNERSGEVDRIRLELPSAAGTCIVPGPDGRIYAPAYPYHLFRFDRDGKPDPWPEGTERYPDSVVNWRGLVDKPSGPLHATYLPVSMTFMTHTFGISYDGRLFALHPGKPRMRPPKMLVEYDRLGRRIGQPVIWKVSDTAIGPKFDAAGNIYIAEQIRPLDQVVPKEFESLVGPVEAGTRVSGAAKTTLCTAYGSILKFNPKRGGMIHWSGTDPFDGLPKLDPSLKSTDALFFRGEQREGKFRGVKVTGAEWMRLGISHVALHYCNCETTRFDVDPFGRVFYPDLCRFRVGVLDTNGNPLTHFGNYGNRDDAGIRCAWLVGVGVTDKYVYLGDSLNRRLLRARLTYLVEESCPIR